MRYTAVCTSMLLDWVYDLGGFQMDVGPRVHNLEQVTSALMGQDKLDNKVNVLSFNWNLNLKYQAQVVNFEAKMLSFSLNESVLVHEDWSQSNSLFQEQFGLHQDWIVTVEETLRSLTTKVRVSSSKSVRTRSDTTPANSNPVLTQYVSPSFLFPLVLVPTSFASPLFPPLDYAPLVGTLVPFQRFPLTLCFHCSPELRTFAIVVYLGPAPDSSGVCMAYVIFVT